MLNSLRKYLSTPLRPVKRQRVPVGNDWLSLAVQSGERSRTVYDPAGKPLRLKKSDILAHGGEGFVYKLGINPHYLVKICKEDTLKNASKQKAFCERLDAMLALEDCRKADFLAWPQMPVSDVNRKEKTQRHLVVALILSRERWVRSAWRFGNYLFSAFSFLVNWLFL